MPISDGDTGGRDGVRPRGSDTVDALQQMIADARNAVAFTGAGISTESGIPDFRSPGGIWTRHKPIPFDAFLASVEARRETWRRKFATHPTIAEATPKAGHRALARLIEQGRMRAVITQNIDGLHQASGVPADKVIELHGNATYAKCLSCGLRHEFDEIEPVSHTTQEPPVCRDCAGIVKSATISFGQA